MTEKDIIRIDQYSTASLALSMYFDGTHLSTGTAFAWSGSRGLFLVTNWHNLSGKNPQTGECLSSMASEPNSVEITCFAKGNLSAAVSAKFKIRDNDNNPTWIIHNEFGKKIDIAAIAIKESPEFDIFPINKMPNMLLSMEVGQEIFILGYPYSKSAASLPIWKKASFASEPKYISEDQPWIYVDTASRPGMSGSPVIRRSWSSHSLENGSTIITPGPATRIVGIYSGRIVTKDPLDAQLGMVWPTRFIEDVVERGVRDTY